MSVIAVKDAGTLAAVAARRLLDRLLGQAGGGRLAVCLTGGSTPEGLYRLLATHPWRDAMPWDRVTWFFGDDRFVPADDPRSNAGMARRLLFDHVPVLPDSIVAVPTDAGDENAAAERYEAALKRHYGADRLDPARPLFDMVLLGLGSDGHTASLFPGHDDSLQETRRWVVGVHDAGLAPLVPRVTLTLPALASTREMMFLVSDPGKREVLSRVLAGDAALPAARAHADGELVWLVTEAVRPPPPGAADADADAAGDRDRLPAVIVVMGVAGAGKTTVAAMLAHRLGVAFEDGDWFHPPSNVAKMSSGRPLDDGDRQAWLEGIAQWITATRTAGGHAVIACSALKRAYRDQLVDGRDDVRIVYLKGNRELIARRFAMRHQHFMPPTMLDSQLATLEEPTADEHATTVSIDAHPRDIVTAAIAGLGLDAHAADAAE